MTTILLSTYNGEKYLKEQIDSLIKQTSDISIYVRDDGSSDATIEILKEYEQEGVLTFYRGENLGAAQSYMDLIYSAPKSDFYAFCDQDDVWGKDKISTALASVIGCDQALPLLYCGVTKPVDEKLNDLPMVKTPKPNLSFGESLVMPYAAGCTFVFNNNARNLFTNKQIGKISMHDWYLYKVIAAHGKIVFDNTPHIFYRQHGKNVIGYNHENIFKKIKKYIFSESGNTRFNDALSIYSNYSNTMDKNNLIIIEKLLNYKKSFKSRIAFIKAKEFKTNNKKLNLLIIFYALTGRL